MLTVGDLAGAIELELACGERTAGSPIRWVHVSELSDPTPWLSGGELLLTTGMALLDEDTQRGYVRRLVEHHLAGLGFGIGFAHAEVPAALLDEARTLDFPVFAVPYEMPFIAITERAFTSLVNEQFDRLQRAVSIQRRMERLVLEERSLGEVVRGLANAVGATMMVLDGAGRPLASHGSRREIDASHTRALGAEVAERARAAEPRGFVPQSAGLAGSAVALPVPGARGAPSWLVAVPESDSVADYERFLAHHAVMVVALAQMRERVVAETERRLAGRSRRSVRAAVSRSAPVEALRRSFHAARCALEVGPLANGAGPAVATPEDLGAYRLLLSLQDDDGLRQYCEDVLAPVERARGGTGDEPLRSLEAFLDHNGNREAAARALFCHRHVALSHVAGRGADGEASRPRREPDRFLARVARAGAARRCGRLTSVGLENEKEQP